MDIHKITLSEEEIKFRYTIQEVIDRLLYCPGYREKLAQFNQEFNIPTRYKNMYEPFKFKKNEAILQVNSCD
jgi:hypothetical protein